MVSIKRFPMRVTASSSTLRRVTRPWNPVDIYFGFNSSLKLGEVVKEFGRRKVFFVTDRIILEKTEMVRTLESILDERKIERTVWADVEPEPRIEVADQVTHAIRQNGYDCVVGLGGGSVLDMAKVAAAMYTNEGDVINYLGVNKLKHKALDLVLIPTTAGTGSDVTNRAMMTADEKAVVASDALYARSSLVDPSLTLTMPPKVTADTGFDALCHSLEGIMSNENFDGVQSVEEAGYEAVKLLLENIRNVVMNGRDLEAREKMMYGALLSGLVLSKKAMVYGHSLAYPFAPRYKIPHGRSTVMALPYVIEFSCHDERCGRKIGRIAEEVGISKPGQPHQEKVTAVVTLIKALIEEVYEYLAIPITLQGVGVPEEDLGWMAKLCLERWPRPTSPVQATEKDISRLYERMWKGE
ncbi:MAG TPA: iron-containing alcohol dehydrogenase [Candidatus Dormibacteraeota bacterium]|nr:iron-containing alcohol dehydrogenase [Candidatus Dormibacteraeota bacterium]